MSPFILAIIFVVIFVWILISAIRIIQPWEQGVYILLGRYKKTLNPGVNMVVPVISNVVRMDLRTQVLDVRPQEIITKDNSPTKVDAIIYIRIMDPKKAIFEVEDYRAATLNLAQTMLRSEMGEMELDEIFSNRVALNERLRSQLDIETDIWGVKVEKVEIQEVDPVGPVKTAMEKQTAAERLRRAAILKADGEKRSAILRAEGDKRARILEAEGIKQANILEAEGGRLARILLAQGESQALRVLTLGASTLDRKALTVLSLNTLKRLGDGQATKIVFPFELTRLIEGAAEYIGAGRKVPEVGAEDYKDLEKIIGKVEDVIGKIPSPEELKREREKIEKDIQEEARKTEEMAKRPSAKLDIPDSEMPIA
ncbi:MAG: SPFH/Band 7/PHB domain protein [Thermoplasmata archaeon]|nr:SPFH/Band 7/PHB domain protein [Thermoplasmata archaeon]